MTLQHIDITDLTVSPLNVRKYGAKDCADLVHSVRALGVLQPLLVRKAADGFEVVAGQRRLNACRTIAEDGDIDPLPCLVMAEGDDAKAIEASLAENIERLPMDEVDQYKAFAALIKQGQSVEDIASQFGITERLVKQRLAIANLLQPILTAYRKEEVCAQTVRLLTMATSKQQKAWLALFKADDEYAPEGYRLKEWLFGGAHISTANALFDLDTYQGNIVSDLFGEDGYFDDPDCFWAAQNVAIAEAKERYQNDGWSEVIILEVGEYFPSYDYVDTDKDNGGKVYVRIANNGEVTFFEGQLSRKDITARDKTTDPDTAYTPEKPALTKAGQNYVDLHRHAAVRSDLLGQSGIALRLMAAHMITGSSLWHVEADPQNAAKAEFAESLEVNAGQIKMAKERAEIAQLLQLENYKNVLEHRNQYEPRPCITEVFATVQALNDQDVLRVLTFLMAESLSVHSPLIGTLGQTMETDMQSHWTPEPLFFDLVRDKQVLNAMVGELAGAEVAKANITTTAKTQRSILTDCLNGTRVPADPNWMPRQMAFPSGTYRGEAVVEEEATPDLKEAA